MDVNAFEKLKEQQIISSADLEKIQAFERHQPQSVHWELRSLLYLGIFLLATGLGILIYENLDTIGHDIIVTTIALSCATCFFYCFKKSAGYSHKKVEPPNLWFDYILLAGCLLLVTFIAYIQFQYNVFGNRWGLATFIPMVLLFAAAYYFDHLGVLSLAITNLAAWVGISVTPMQVLTENDFSSERIILSGVLLGAGLATFAAVTEKHAVKTHFAFTYKNFGTHILFISAVAALFHFEEIYLAVFIGFAAIAFVWYRNAIKGNSFYFLVTIFLYSYIALGYVVIRLLDVIEGDGALYLGLVYFIASGIGLIRLLMYYNKTIKTHDSLQQNRPLQ